MKQKQSKEGKPKQQQKLNAQFMRFGAVRKVPAFVCLVSRRVEERPAMLYWRNGTWLQINLLFMRLQIASCYCFHQSEVLLNPFLLGFYVALTNFSEQVPNS